MASGALPLSPDDVPKTLRDTVIKARRAWLRNTEVEDLLNVIIQSKLETSTEAPWLPTTGTLYTFNRRSVRFFRKDGYVWKKKSDNKTVKEVHEKLKIGSKEALNCYYAHAEEGMQRRCYWLLNGDDAIVLVHYLNTKQSKPVQQLSWSHPRPVDPVTGQLPTAPRISRNVALSFSEVASGSSFSAGASSYVESASGSFTITTGHLPRPVAEFRLNSRGVPESLGRRLSSLGVASPLPPGVGAGPGPQARDPVGPGAKLQQSPFLAPPGEHGFEDDVLNLNRGGTLPQEAMPAAVREAEEHRASALTSSFASRRRGVQGGHNTAFVPYNSTSELGRRRSQPAVSAFE